MDCRGVNSNVSSGLPIRDYTDDTTRSVEIRREAWAATRGLADNYIYNVIVAAIEKYCWVAVTGRSEENGRAHPALERTGAFAQ